MMKESTMRDVVARCEEGFAAQIATHQKKIDSMTLQVEQTQDMLSIMKSVNAKKDDILSKKNSQIEKLQQELISIQQQQQSTRSTLIPKPSIKFTKTTGYSSKSIIPASKPLHKSKIFHLKEPASQPAVVQPEVSFDTKQLDKMQSEVTLTEIQMVPNEQPKKTEITPNETFQPNTSNEIIPVAETTQPSLPKDESLLDSSVESILQEEFTLVDHSESQVLQPNIEKSVVQNKELRIETKGTQTDTDKVDETEVLSLSVSEPKLNQHVSCECKVKDTSFIIQEKETTQVIDIPTQTNIASSFISIQEAVTFIHPIYQPIVKIIKDEVLPDLVQDEKEDSYQPYSQSIHQGIPFSFLFNRYTVFCSVIYLMVRYYK